MNCSLFIDTSDNKEITVGLKIDGKEYYKSQKVDRRRAQAVLPMAEELLKEHDLSLKNITGIEVAMGPGSFTGLRVGITVANTLATLLKVPVNGKKLGEMAEAVYR